MNGMQVSSVLFQELNHEFRIDSEFYREEILNRLDVLNQKNRDKLSALAEFVIGPFGSTVTVDKYTETSKYRYVRNRDISDFRIKNDDPAFISKGVYDSLPRFHIQSQDLLITVVGTLGKVAMATTEDAKSIFSCKSTIVRPKTINPFYLLTYLNSDTGRLFSLRGKRGAIQEGLNLTDLEEVQVFVPTNAFQMKIEGAVKDAFESIDESTILFSRVQELLLSELGLSDWRPKRQLTFVRENAHVRQAGRTDSEYFQPMYEEIVNAVKNYAGGWDTVENLVRMNDKNFKPDNGTEYKYIELANIGGSGEIVDCKVGLGQNLPSRARRRVARGDVIVSSIEGSLSSTALIDAEYDHALCSTGFHVINSKVLNAGTLLVLLKSVIGQLQLKKGCSGTILTAINKDEFGRIVLPIVPEAKQTQIQQMVAESFNKRNRSKHLLKCAKHAVEMAIKQDEQTAIDWLRDATADSRACLGCS